MVDKTPEEGIVTLLENASVGVFNSNEDWSIVIGTTIDQPDNLISVMGTSGKAPNPMWNIDFPSVQVKVRGANSNYVAARQKARDIKDALLGLPSQNVNGDRWTAINMIGDITPIGNDAKQRPMFTINFALIIEPTAAGNRLTQ